MKIKMLSILALSAICFTACKKDCMISTLEQEVTGEVADVHLPTSQYKTNIPEALEKTSDSENYTKGSIEYIIDDVVIAKVEFGENEAKIDYPTDYKGYSKKTCTKGEKDWDKDDYDKKDCKKKDWDKKDYDKDDWDKKDYDKDDFDLKKEGSKSHYKKVIEKPLVKTDDCQYIVEGLIHYYDKNGSWVATIDYGNGNCDDTFTKTTSDGHKGDYSMNLLKK